MHSVVIEPGSDKYGTSCEVFRCERCGVAIAVYVHPEGRLIMGRGDWQRVIQQFRFRTCAQVRMRKALG